MINENGWNVNSFFFYLRVLQTGCMYVYGGVCEIDTVRTSDIYRIWLTVPSLKELCWNKFSQSVRDLETVPKGQLFETGVPMDMIARVG